MDYRVNLNRGDKVMIDKDDWRLLNDVEFLRGKYLDPVSSNEIVEHLPHLKHCLFCWDKVPEKLNYYQTWYITADRNDCVCKNCFNDFQDYLDLHSTDGNDVVWD